MSGPPQGGREWGVENPTPCWDRRLLLGGRWVPEGPRHHPKLWLPLLVASPVGDRALRLTPVLGDPGTAALLSGLQLSLVFLPGKSHGQRSLADNCPKGHKESDMTE